MPGEVVNVIKLFLQFWKFMMYIRFTICSPLCLIFVSSFCELWKIMWDVGIIFVLLLNMMQME
jgi:hypothetical protein